MLQQNGDYGVFRTNVETVFDHGLLIEYRVRLYRKEDEIAFFQEEDNYYDLSKHIFHKVVWSPSKQQIGFSQLRSCLQWQLWLKPQSNGEVFYTDRAEYMHFPGEWYLMMSPFCCMEHN